jgi:hypothetical protein
MTRSILITGGSHGIAWRLDPTNTMQVGQCLNLDGGVVQD